MTLLLSPIGGAAGQFFDSNGVPLSGGKIYTYAAGTTTPLSTYMQPSPTDLHANPIILDSAGRPPGGEIWLTDGFDYKFIIKTSTNVLVGSYDNLAGINSTNVRYTAQSEIQTATAGQTIFTLTTVSYLPGTNTLLVFVDGVNQYVDINYLETNTTTVTFLSGLTLGAKVRFLVTRQISGDTFNSDAVIYDPPFTGGVFTSAENKFSQTVSVKDFGATGDGATDDTLAIQAAINYVADLGGAVYFPRGDYRLVGQAGLDGIVTGITVPFKGGGIEGNAKGITLYGDGSESRLIAASASMYVVRFIGNNSTFRDLCIIGNDTSSGLVLTSANITADRGDEQISYNAFTRLLIGNCGENGILLQCPLGSQAGGVYYNNFSDIYIYYGGSGASRKGRGIYMRELSALGSNGSNNRNTFRGVTLKRLNTGVQIDDGDTNSFYSCHFEAINGTGGPNATPTAVKIGPAVYRSTQLNRFFGCQTESVTRGIDNNDPATELYGCDFRNSLYTVYPRTQIGGNDTTLANTIFNGWFAQANLRNTSVNGTVLNTNTVRAVSGSKQTLDFRSTFYLGSVPGNSAVKTLTLLFDTPLATTSDVDLVVQTSFFGNNNGWDATGLKRIATFAGIFATKTATYVVTDDTTGSFGGINTAGYVTRSGLTVSPTAINIAYTFNAGTSADSPVHAAVTVYLGSTTTLNVSSFTASWS